MSGKPLIASLALFAATAAYASPSDVKSDVQWTQETRQLPKVSIDVYHRTPPYALTGRMAEPARRSSGEWLRETRQLPKVSIDVYRR